MLAEKIREHRRSAGLTQRELAQALKISQNTVSQYESGKRNPTVKKLVEISALLGCSVSELTANSEKA